MVGNDHPFLFFSVDPVVNFGITLCVRQKRNAKIYYRVDFFREILYCSHIRRRQWVARKGFNGKPPTEVRKVNTLFFTFCHGPKGRFFVWLLRIFATSVAKMRQETNNPAFILSQNILRDASAE